MSQLRIRIPSTWQDAATPCEWALCEASGAVLEQGTAPLAALPKVADCIAIIPAARITCVSVPVPAQARRRWEAALPFIAEEYTLTEPEQNHVVPAPGESPRQRTLYIVDKHWLQNIVQAGQAAQIALRRAVPEMLLAPLPEGGWTLVWQGARGFLRTGAYCGIALDELPDQHPPLPLQLSLAATENAPRKLRLCLPEGMSLPQWPDCTLDVEQGAAWDWKRQPIPAGLPNLLWGELAPPLRIAEHLPRLRPLALILVAALLIETLGIHLQWVSLAQERAALTRDMERTFRQTFGDAATLVDPALQMQRKLAELRHATGEVDESDFLPLLDQAAPALIALPPQSVQAMHYDGGRLDVELRLGRSELEALETHLRRKGLRVAAGAPQDSGGKLAVRLALQAGGTP